MFLDLINKALKTHKHYSSWAVSVHYSSNLIFIIESLSLLPEIKYGKILIIINFFLFVIMQVFICCLKRINHLLSLQILGDVVYSVDGFLDKNRDTLFDDFKRLLYHSKNPILSSMWPEGEKSITSVTRRPLTAGTIFRNSMISLSNLLSSKVIENTLFEYFYV